MDTPATHSAPGQAWQWQPGFAALGDRFCAVQPPTPLPQPYWVGSSAQVAALLPLPPGWNTSAQWLDAFTGNVNLHGTQPRATVYSGHQFGVWAGQLGDGRALLLGEVKGLELQLKGAGPTPFSRMGDGRAVLRSSIREFLCSEAMHGLGIPTTRALCITGSDAPVQRETRETAAVVTRVAPSFIRFGHFEHFAHTGQHQELRDLADYVIDRYYPACRSAEAWQGNPYAALLAAVAQRTAHTVAQWQAVGFCHGVMNTDNMSILGLTMDYGPFQFLDAFDPGHICNHSDHQGRYAFGRQPEVARWNLFCLGHALLPLIAQPNAGTVAGTLAAPQTQTEGALESQQEEAQRLALSALETYPPCFAAALDQAMATKLGFARATATTQALAQQVLQLLANDRVDYTIFWRTLSRVAQSRGFAAPAAAELRDLFIDRKAFDAWLHTYAAQVQAAASSDNPHDAERMLRHNPKFVLRNYLGALAIEAAQAKDFQTMAQLQQVLERPCDEHPAFAHWAGPPPDWARSIAISCSS